MNLQKINSKEEWWFVLGATASSYFSRLEGRVIENKDYFDSCFERQRHPYDALNMFDYYLTRKQ